MGISLLNSAALLELSNWPSDPGKSLLQGHCWTEIARFAGLTSRELDVCQALFEGLTCEEVASELGLSASTVRHHMESLHSKLSVSTRRGLALRVIQIRDYLAQTPEML
ncbi:MAG: helix-turn-helix transcriptional regulator [Planctomycetota bacterium]